MKFKKFISTLLAVGLLSLSSSANYKNIKRYGPGYQIKKGKTTYSAQMCSSITDRVNGWCIQDDKKNFVTDPKLYADLAYTFESMKETKMMTQSVNKSKKAFDSILNVQLIMDTSKFSMDNLSEINGGLIFKGWFGGASASVEVQKEIIQGIFKDKQKEIYSMYSEEIQKFSDDLLNGKISEGELRLKLRKAFGSCYEYQVKLASSELERFQRLNQKKNKTAGDFELMRDYMVDGLARGYMATAYFNVINESRTIDKSAKSILEGLAKGSGLDSVLDLEFLVNNPDIERATIESEKVFNQFYNRFMENSKYWDTSIANSNAARLLLLLNNVNEIHTQQETQQNTPSFPFNSGSEVKKQMESQEVKPIPNLVLGRKSYIDLNCDGTNETILVTESGNTLSLINPQETSCPKNFSIIINSSFMPSEFYVPKLISSGECGYLMKATTTINPEDDCSLRKGKTAYYYWDGNRLIQKEIKQKLKRKLERKIDIQFKCSDESVTLDFVQMTINPNYKTELDKRLLNMYNQTNNICKEKGMSLRYIIYNREESKDPNHVWDFTLISENKNSTIQEFIREINNLRPNE
ncbi:MAG: hypothetical protein PHF86_05405 [Candidatus Nanoarchaeia archaeon]|nr:hypothetical protein [Candidatus Nanoarchaeia archaeon]